MRTIVAQVLARLETLDELRDVVLGLGPETGAPPEVLRRWALAIYEAATNVVKHGHGGRSDAVITLTVELECSQVTFLMEDTGRPHPDYMPPAYAPSENGGFGIRVIYQIMDRVEYRSTATGCNELRLTAFGWGTSS